MTAPPLVQAPRAGLRAHHHPAHARLGPPGARLPAPRELFSVLTTCTTAQGPAVGGAEPARPALLPRAPPPGRDRPRRAPESLARPCASPPNSGPAPTARGRGQAVEATAGGLCLGPPRPGFLHGCVKVRLPRLQQRQAPSLQQRYTPRAALKTWLGFLHGFASRSAIFSSPTHAARRTKNLSGLFAPSSTPA